MFQSSVPVSADGFFDRETALAELERLIERLEAGQPSWLAIIGPRKIGKTSLVVELARRAARTRTELHFLVIDAMEVAPLSFRIFRRYALRAVDQVFASELGVSPEMLAGRPAEYRAALERSSAFARLSPAVRAGLLELPERELDADGVAACLEVPEQLAAGLGRRFVVAFDEFQELAGLARKRQAIDPLPLMRSVWQRHRRCAYVVSGSGRTMLTNLVTREHSPFFQHFGLLELGRFAPADGERLLVAGAARDRPIPPELARRAVATLGGHPFYLQLLGEAITGRPPPYDDRTLKAAVQEILFSRTGRLALYFQNEFERLVGRSTYLAALLEAVAEGPTRITDIANRIGATTGATVRYIERVADAIVRRDDGTYQLDDPTFGLWLRWRRPGGTVVPMSVVGDEAELTVARHLARMGFELVYQSRGSRGAFDLLATRGGLQLGVQVKRQALPLRFSRADWDRMKADAKRLGWRWVVASVDLVGEVQILDPALARRGKEVRLASGAVVDNLLDWLQS